MKSILIIDDDPDIRSLLCDAVGGMGYASFPATDGEKGLEILKEVQVDLIILDWMLPGRDGPSILKELREMPSTEHVPVIMLTAREGLQDKLEAFEGGADEYITKPFQFKELQARIKALLRIRDLNVDLRQKNAALLAMQEQLIEKERQLILLEFAGTAAHKLGQPLSAIILNCHLLETLAKEDPKFKKALEALKADTKRMSEILEGLRAARSARKTDYYDGIKILDVEEKGEVGSLVEKKN